MKELTLREAQIGEYSVLKKLAAICDKLHLRYMLAYGTLLGAIRHKGFIPWDDDIDVFMPRPDYNRLIDYLTQHKNDIKPLELMHYSVRKDYIYPIARLSDSRYTFNFETEKDYGVGAFVDIYPHDCCGNTFSEAQEICKINQRYMSLISLCGQKKFRASPKGVLRTIAKFGCHVIANIIGVNRLIAMLDKKAQKRKFGTERLCYCTVWGTKSEGAFACEEFDNRIQWQFEDSEFSIPQNYDMLLRLWFGDYMQLPPEEERIAHHYYKAYMK